MAMPVRQRPAENLVAVIIIVWPVVFLPKPKLSWHIFEHLRQPLHGTAYPVAHRYHWAIDAFPVRYTRLCTNESQSDNRKNNLCRGGSN